jgi:hypothetical protein
MSCCCFTSYNLKHLENIKKYINRATEYLTQENPIDQENKTQENQVDQENKTQENQVDQENKTQENPVDQEEDEYDIVN